MPLNMLGFQRGQTTASSSTLLASSRPAMSSQLPDTSKPMSGSWTMGLQSFLISGGIADKSLT